MARPADICDARALRLAKAHEKMGAAWRNYADDKCSLEPCEICDQWLPAFGIKIEIVPSGDSEDAKLTCVLCDAKKPQPGDY